MLRLRIYHNGFHNKQAGSVAIETVFLLPIILILLFAIIHYSMIFFAASLFNHAAKEGIRHAVSYVDEECYFSSAGCQDETLLVQIKPVVQTHALQIIKGFTSELSGNEWALFGVILPDKEELITLTTIEGGGCCKVIIHLPNYHSTPFLPLNIIDGLIPGEGSVFPNQIMASAVLKLN